MMTTMRFVAAIVAAASVLSACDRTSPEGPITKSTATSAPAAPPASGAPSGAASNAGGFACGSRENPCPMQRWMKTVMMGAYLDRDPAKIVDAMTYAANHAPPGYPKWGSITSDAIAKARGGDIDGAKESCRTCHDAYKDHYQKTMRDRPF